MMRKFISLFFFGLILLTCGNSSNAAQATDAEEQSPASQLKARAKLFYQDILKTDRMAALELVAPESKNQFLNNRYDGLADFRISGVELAKSGDQATVKVVRVVKMPPFRQPLEMTVDDTWHLSNGQWYYILPPPGELDTPFGKMKFDPSSKPSDAEALEMKQRVEGAYKNVDPDQYIQALRQFQNKTAADPKAGAGDKPSQAGAADAKADNSKKPPAATTNPHPENPKPQQ